uniref:HAT C-terminal dimerisation domain-containing protein n=1 Tax=Amphimedon queenslandica TaxID=400682 RepID=A0A1X7UJ78_AMPQE
MKEAFDSRYELPDQSYFARKAVPELYAITKDKVVREVAAVNRYATTTDLWSSVDMKPYISYTIQFITEDVMLRSLVLCTSFFPLDPTGENMSEMVKSTMEEWNFKPTPQVCSTTDSGSNIRLQLTC